jgi:beta-aspartyl-dipeptidase (metallo-type)
MAVYDAKGRMVTPGFIDQHIHITGAGGKHGFASMTPEINVEELVACGTTTVVGLLGTDGSARSIKSLYAKAKALEAEGISAYMFTGYYGIDPVHITGTVKDDIMFVDKVLGCKIAISDVRSSYPTDLELLRILRDVRVGGMLAGKKGILHLHLGGLDTKMDQLFRLVQEHKFPIENISPTHVGRTEQLFEQAIEFARLGGSIDITTGASKYTDPYRSVVHAVEKGIPMHRMTFSSDGNAGLDKKDAAGNMIGFRRAPFDQNFGQTVALIKEAGFEPSEAFKLITSSPAENLGLKNKGTVAVGADADLCVLNDAYQLTDIFAMGQQVMKDEQVTIANSFKETHHPA